MLKHVQTCAVLLLLVVTPAAWPQGGNSTVRGLVRDQAQAIIPSAAVTLTNVNTNVTRTTLSNDAGIYVFPGVIPGSYRLTGEFAGMQKFEGNLTVQTSSDLSVDITLSVAQAVTNVQVHDVTPIMQTDSSALSSTLERQRIEELPLLGRGYQNLLQTVPGLVYSNHGHQTGGRALAFWPPGGSAQVAHGGQPFSREKGGLGVAPAPGFCRLPGAPLRRERPP